MARTTALFYSLRVRSLSLLLRVVVGLGLILNGPGYASATSMMQLAGPVEASTHGAEPADDASPCPQHAAPTLDREPPAGGTSTPHDPTKHRHGTPGCCGSAACASSCAVHAAVSFAECVSGALPVHVDALRPMSVAHASPALPPRIRPPIA
jgi:hypothetical protein